LALGAHGAVLHIDDEQRGAFALGLWAAKTSGFIGGYLIGRNNPFPGHGHRSLLKKT
jgi:hypothetical protein